MATKGYTLIEIMVAVGIFFVIIAAPTGFFVASLKGQQRALASQELLDNVSYALEYISRSIRMTKKDDIEISGVTLNCLTEGYKVNYAITAQGIKFRNYNNECQEFFLEGGRLKESKDGVINYLTSDDLMVEKFEISLSGEDQADTLQPKVTLFLEVKGNRGSSPDLQPVIKIQTTISQRDLDVQY